MSDPLMFGPFFPGFPAGSWRNWGVLLKASTGLALADDELEVFTYHTGREIAPTVPVDEVVIIIGRRAGKSRIMATLAVHAATVPDYTTKLAPGETPTVAIIASDKKQARTIFKYARGLLLGVELLAPLLESETAEALTLTNGVVIEVHVASYRSVRGYTLVCAICDEIAFWRAGDTAANPDTEILNALRPALGTLGGKLLIASSPYAKKGALYEAFRDNFGVDDPEVLVWKASTLEMNPGFSKRIIEKAYERDAAAADAEYGGNFRDDVSSFVSREVVDSCTVMERRELPPVNGLAYVGFCDPSGGSSDSMTLGVAHMEGERSILDALREVNPPFSPESVVTDFAALLKSYRVSRVTGDRYAGMWPRERFLVHGVEYEVSEKTKSDIYRDTLPLLNGNRAELLDLSRLHSQLCGLERRTFRGGRDSIDHAPGQHDDVVNAAAGALLLATVVVVKPEPIRMVRSFHMQR